MNPRRHSTAGIAIAIGLLTAAGAGLAAEPVTGPIAESAIREHALGNVRGAVQVNLAAGDHNLQVNAGAIALGPHSDSHAHIRQRTGARLDGDGEARASIGARAFAGAAGWLSINQAAGAGNAQSNVLLVSTGIEGHPLGDDDLADAGIARQDQPGSADANGARARADIDPSAFATTYGVVQVNQAAGRGNATGNRFELRMHGAAGP